MSERQVAWDRFAAASLSGLIGQGGDCSKDIAHDAATIADAMMVERDKRMVQRKAIPVRVPVDE